MTVLVGIAALVMAACAGYYVGRRVGPKPTTWRKRTSRIALGKLAIDLLVALTARRIRRRFRVRLVAPLELLRASAGR
ncbi:hypothetical protein A5672_20495 [Mycobacterium alsense]|uniref:Uncharacterized protein n=1 Tax=Mycobacterium alsense TaxID=324058 RepID=A0ABD6P1E8_9MYCO|nr:hypothetical protein [Mycobacterium alsense]OBG36100.1 hypothetical protein A5672_20495 [Mycobacterium alsense]